MSRVLRGVVTNNTSAGEEVAVDDQSSRSPIGVMAVSTWFGPGLTGRNRANVATPSGEERLRCRIWGGSSGTIQGLR